MYNLLINPQTLRKMVGNQFFPKFFFAGYISFITYRVTRTMRHQTIDPEYIFATAVLIRMIRDRRGK
jgi:hypothetical protein